MSSQDYLSRQFPPPYLPAPVEWLTAAARAPRLAERPVLDIYLDGTLAIEELLIAYSHRAFPGVELVQEVSEEVARSGEALAKRVDLANHLATNALRVLDLGEWYGTFVAEAISAERIDDPRETQRLWDPLRPLDNIRDAVSRVAHISTNAIAYECRVVWDLMRRNSYRAADLDRAIRDLTTDTG